MYRISLYTLLFVVVMLLQIFVFDRLTFSIIVAPLIYITTLVVLPTQTSQLEMMFWSLVVGISADFCMGMAGVNTIATLFVGYTRIYIMNITFGKEVVALGGVPIVAKLGYGRYLSYLIIMVAIHSLIFFAVESLTIVSWQFILKRFVVSSIVSFIFVWLLSYIFGSLLTRKV
ncbi:MAG: rod shape-determining protein MreD [Rikenellaceae bacterium]